MREVCRVVRGERGYSWVRACPHLSSVQFLPMNKARNLDRSISCVRSQFGTSSFCVNIAFGHLFWWIMFDWRALWKTWASWDLLQRIRYHKMYENDYISVKHSLFIMLLHSLGRHVSTQFEVIFRLFLSQNVFW